MKIMKDRKQLGHNDLIAVLIQNLNFPIENSFIKQRIDSLIEKDYLRRNNENAAIYEYVA